jgi:N-acetylmuramic acid 6-phosphate etherase
MAVQARRAGEAVAGAAGLIAPVVEAVVRRLATGGRLIYVGAGTAGRIGMLDAAEAAPTFSVPDGMITGIMAGGQEAFGSAQENVEDDPGAGAYALDRLGVGERDAVLGISASGRTPYVVGAVRRANEVGALTACLACNENTPLGAVAQFPIEIRVGPEVIAGSTRLNAGTVQKIVLNIISTAAMVRLGKTYGSLMVDVRPTNTKLRERAVRIVTEISGVSSRDARWCPAGGGPRWPASWPPAGSTRRRPAPCSNGTTAGCATRWTPPGGAGSRRAELFPVAVQYGGPAAVVLVPGGTGVIEDLPPAVLQRDQGLLPPRGETHRHLGRRAHRPAGMPAERDRARRLPAGHRAPHADLAGGRMLDDLAAGERDPAARAVHAVRGQRPPVADTRGEHLERLFLAGFDQHLTADRR